VSHSATNRLAGDVLWHRLVPSIPLLVGLVAFGRLLAERMALLNDPDTYLHIAAGRWMLLHGALPVHDPFSHSMAGARWIPSEWLAEIALALAYDHLGWGGVILLAAVSAAAALMLLMHFLLRQMEPLPALIVAVAAAALLQPHILARPHVLALPCLVAWCGLLLAARDAERPPPFAALAIMALWANLHGSFLFGLALAGFLGGDAVLWPSAGRTRRAEALRWGAFVAAAVAAALVTPWGIAHILQPIRLTLMPTLQSTFAEWLSPDFSESPALEMWMLGLLFIGYATGVRLPIARLVLLLGLVHMTLQHARHGDLLAVVAPLAVAAPLGRHLAALTAASARSRLGLLLAELAQPSALPAVAVALAIAAALAAPTALHPVVRGDDAVTPGAALHVVEGLGLTGPVFNSEGFGGYLLFRSVPSFIDGRVEMYGDAFLKRDFEAENGNEAVLAELLSRYHIAWTLLRPDEGAVLVMDHLPGWQRVFGDMHAVVHRRIAAK
jgi:hypothetical protein